MINYIVATIFVATIANLFHDDFKYIVSNISYFFININFDKTIEIESFIKHSAISLTSVRSVLSLFLSLFLYILDNSGSFILVRKLIIVQLKSISNTRKICRTKKTKPEKSLLASDILASMPPRQRISVSILPNFLPFDSIGVYVYTAHRYNVEKSSIVLFHRARLVRAPNPVVCDLHSLGLSDRKPGIHAPKLALHNNLAVSKAHAHSRARCSLILYAFIYLDRIHRVYPGITCAICSRLVLFLAVLSSAWLCRK